MLPTVLAALLLTAEPAAPRFPATCTFTESADRPADVKKKGREYERISVGSVSPPLVVYLNAPDKANKLLIASNNGEAMATLITNKEWQTAILEITPDGAPVLISIYWQRGGQEPLAVMSRHTEFMGYGIPQQLYGTCVRSP